MRSASPDTLRRRLGLAVPKILGARRVLAIQRWQCQVFLAEATQDWQCQELLAWEGLLPLIIGSARDYWRLAGSRHSSLALPEIPGTQRVFATQLQT